jgi:hypothetical protein
MPVRLVVALGDDVSTNARATIVNRLPAIGFDMASLRIGASHPSSVFKNAIRALYPQAHS